MCRVSYLAPVQPFKQRFRPAYLPCVSDRDIYLKSRNCNYCNIYIWGNKESCSVDLYTHVFQHYQKFIVEIPTGQEVMCLGSFCGLSVCCLAGLCVSTQDYGNAGFRSRLLAPESRNSGRVRQFPRHCTAGQHSKPHSCRSHNTPRRPAAAAAAASSHEKPTCRNWAEARGRQICGTDYSDITFPLSFGNPSFVKNP